MDRRNKARRPRQRTAHTLDGIPGLIAFYADSLANSMLAGFAAIVRGRPHHIGAFGTIETKVHRSDRPVVLDARKVIGAPERVVCMDGYERCVVTLALTNGRTVRVGLDAPCEQVAQLLRKARG